MCHPDIESATALTDRSNVSLSFKVISHTSWSIFLLTAASHIWQGRQLPPCPLPPETKDFCFTHCKKNNYYAAHYVNSLTGSPIVTTPYILMTLMWLNWPIMAASCRNLTLSSSEDPAFKVLTANSSSCLHMLHDALYTSPN